MNLANVGTWALSVIGFLAFCALLLLIEKWIDARYAMGDDDEG